LDYESEKSDKLKLSQVGTGGLTELREALDDSKASYAYVRITYANDKESTRQKFILVVRHPKIFLFHDSQTRLICFISFLVGLDWSGLQSHEESQGENLQDT
jgi:serine protease inhibitor